MRVDKQNVSFFLGFVRQLRIVHDQWTDGAELPDEIAGELIWFREFVLNLAAYEIEAREEEDAESTSDDDVDSGFDRDDEPESPSERPHASGEGRRVTSQLGGDVGDSDHTDSRDSRGVDAAVARATLAPPTCDRTQKRRMRG